MTKPYPKDRNPKALSIRVTTFETQLSPHYGIGISRTVFVSLFPKKTVIGSILLNNLFIKVTTNFLICLHKICLFLLMFAVTTKHKFTAHPGNWYLLRVVGAPPILPFSNTFHLSSSFSVLFVEQKKKKNNKKLPPSWKIDTFLYHFKNALLLSRAFCSTRQTPCGHLPITKREVREGSKLMLTTTIVAFAPLFTHNLSKWLPYSFSTAK